VGVLGILRGLLENLEFIAHVECEDVVAYEVEEVEGDCDCVVDFVISARCRLWRGLGRSRLIMLRLF
jgi:hypothetical protein